MRFKDSETYRDLTALIARMWQMLRDTWKVVLPFLVGYSVVNVVVTVAITGAALWAAMACAHIPYLGQNNLTAFFSTPSTIIILIASLFLVVMLHMVEIAGIMHAYNASIAGVKTSLAHIIGEGVRAATRCLAPSSWLVVPFMLLLIPLTGFFTLSFSSVQAYIPSFVKEFIDANALYHAAYLAIYTLLLLVQVLFIFSINFFVADKTSFFAACRKSRLLIKGRYLFTLACLVVVTLLVSMIVVSLSAILSAAITMSAHTFGGPSTFTDAARMGNWMFSLSRFLGAILAPAINIAAITALFISYLKEKDKQRLAPSVHASAHRPLPRATSVTIAMALAASVAGSLAVTPINLLESGPLDRPGIVAHRGDSVNAPENTMPAFELALAEDPDWIELDVHLTKDGVVVVSHDDNLKRVTGKQVFMHELTYDEAVQLDAGSWFNKEFEGTHFSTLDEVLKLYKDKIPVQIELKSDGPTEGLVESVLKVVNDNGMRDQIIFTSLDSDLLRHVKEVDPQMITTYSMFIALGDVASAEFADYYTVEESNINPALVQNIHDAGGKVFCWTVNSDSRVQYLVDCGVDGILTDNPLMMRNAFDTSSYLAGGFKLLRLYLSQLVRF